MEYRIHKLAQMAGVSTRTLRFYDKIGLLSPAGVRANGYRFYGQKEIDQLQQILFYRELDVPLENIKKIIDSEGFDGEEALEKHLVALESKRNRLDRLILTLEKTIQATKGDAIMKDEDKFEGFKQKLIDDNENQFGVEARTKYGEDAVNASNAKLRGMKPEQYAQSEKQAQEINELLKKAIAQGDPAGALAQQLCDLHKKWICNFWPSYDKLAHMALGQMYVEDPRFSAYYDKITPGGAGFLRDALRIYCQ